MPSRKTKQPRMEPYWTPELTGHSWKDIPFRMTWRRLLLRNKNIKPKVKPKVPSELKLWRRI